MGNFFSDRGFTGKQRGQQVIAQGTVNHGRSGTVQDGMYTDSDGDNVATVREATGSTFDEKTKNLKDIHNGT